VNISLDRQKPICPQLCEQICVMIAAGELEPGAKMMSVREVALAAGVNPNTVQKSFEELERKGLLSSVRGVGWFVGEDTSAAKETVRTLLALRTKEYFEQTLSLGLSEEETKRYIEEWNR